MASNDNVQIETSGQYFLTLFSSVRSFATYNDIHSVRLQTTTTMNTFHTGDSNADKVIILESL